MSSKDGTGSHSREAVWWMRIGGVAALLGLAIGIPAFLDATRAGSTPSLDLTGTWSGEVTGDDRAYPVSVAIRDDGTTAMATSTYPDIPCRGTWVQQSRTASGVSFLEDMPDGVVCFDGVPVHVELEGGVLIFTAESGGRSLRAELRAEGG